VFFHKVIEQLAFQINRHRLLLEHALNKKAVVKELLRQQRRTSSVNFFQLCGVFLFL
jgi:hypothetical protein